MKLKNFISIPPDEQAFYSEILINNNDLEEIADGQEYDDDEWIKVLKANLITYFFI